MLHFTKSCMPIWFCSCRPNSNETRVPNFKAEVFQRTKTNRKGFCVQNENKNEKGVITLEKMLYISLDFSLIFPPFLGIDHLENVSMRYRYPKVLGYRVLGIGIDPALHHTEEHHLRILPMIFLFVTSNAVLNFSSLFSMLFFLRQFSQLSFHLSF